MARPSATLLTHLRGVGLCMPWLAWLLVADVTLSALLPFKCLFPNGIYYLSSGIAFSVCCWIQYQFERANGAVITTSGDALPLGESAIVVCNHVAWCDFYMIQALAIRSGMLGRCRWLAKMQLRYVPFLGWGLWAMGMPMVTRDWVRDRGELDRTFKGIVKKKWPTWLISFTEATRFTPEKYRVSQKWCESNGRPQPQHLLYPRTKGFVATVQHLRSAPHVKAVYDVAIAYQQHGYWQEAPNIWATMSLPSLSRMHGYRFHVHARRFPVKDLPQEDEALADWLEARWVEKGNWLEELRLRWKNTGVEGQSF